MKKLWKWITTTLLVLMFISGCAVPTDENPTYEAGTATSAPQATPTETPMPTQTQTPLPKSEGPFLLIQTGTNEYQILDFDLGLATPFDPPESGEEYQLAMNLSPSGRQMIFPVSATEVQVMDLSTGHVHTTYSLTSDRFQPEQAAEEALEALAGMDYDTEAMVAALESAYAESNATIRWYQSDDYRLSVLTASETSTNLYLDEHLTGMRTQLEEMPGLVETAWANSDGSYILLKKGFVFEPGVWQDDAHYLVDVAARQARAIPMPAKVENPQVSWLGPQSIGIIHQSQATGLEGFSIFDLQTGETALIFDGPFNNILRYGDGLLLFQYDPGTKTTSVQTLTLEGQILASQTISEPCFHNNVVGDQIILNCETESLILDATLQPRPFGDPVFLLSAAPDGETVILVTRTDNVFLLDASLEMGTPLTLTDIPLEVRWLPDGSGFLYRTPGKLFHYDLAGETSILLLESDAWNDYTNINAVWVNLQ